MCVRWSFFYCSNIKYCSIILISQWSHVFQLHGAVHFSIRFTSELIQFTQLHVTINVSIKLSFGLTHFFQLRGQLIDFSIRFFSLHNSLDFSSLRLSRVASSILFRRLDSCIYEFVSNDTVSTSILKPPVGFEPTTSRLLSGCSAS